MYILGLLESVVVALASVVWKKSAVHAAPSWALTLANHGCTFAIYNASNESTELDGQLQATYTIVNSAKNLEVEVGTSIRSTHRWSCTETKTLQHATSVLNVSNEDSGALIPHCAVSVTSPSICIKVTVLA
jgi:hypothetical protein